MAVTLVTGGIRSGKSRHAVAPANNERKREDTHDPAHIAA